MHHFDDYLRVLDSTGTSSVNESGKIVEVLSAVDRSRPDQSHEIESRIKSDLLVDDIQTAPVRVLGVLASGGRFRFTFENIVAYVDARAVDDELVGYLEDHRGLAVPDDTSLDRREALAAQILNAKDLSIDARIAHVTHLVKEVAPSRSMETETKLLAALVSAGLLVDDATTFHALGGSTVAQEAFLVASRSATDFINSIGLTEDFIARLFRNEATDRNLKQFLADNLPTNPSWQSADVYEALGDSLREDQLTLYIETARLMVESSASPPTRALALSQYAKKAGFEVVAHHVSTLGEPYSRLLERSHSSVEIPKNPNFRDVLEVLKNGDHGPVSSWDPLDSAPNRVWMRHPTD